MKVEQILEVPRGERFVAMVNHHDQIFVATEYRLYRVSDPEGDSYLSPVFLQEKAEGGS